MAADAAHGQALLADALLPRPVAQIGLRAFFGGIVARLRVPCRALPAIIGVELRAQRLDAVGHGLVLLDLQLTGLHRRVRLIGLRLLLGLLHLDAGGVERIAGDADAALAAAKNVHEAEYTLPLLSHAPMEPMNATAHLTGTGLTVWTPTQDPGTLRAMLAGQLGLDQADVRVEATLAGGAFGRRIEPDPVLEAVACSRVAGAPVSVLWTRDDDMRHDSYRPMSVHRLSAVVDADGVGRVHAVADQDSTVAAGEVVHLGVDLARTAVLPE